MKWFGVVRNGMEEVRTNGYMYTQAGSLFHMHSTVKH